VKIVTDMPY